MEYSVSDALTLLAQTPKILDALVRNLPEPWLRGNEGPDTWSPFEVVGHFVYGEQVNWIQRARVILDHGETQGFPPFNRTGMYDISVGKNVGELLDEFSVLRARNLELLKALNLDAAKLELTGKHPEFGQVKLRQLLATWVAHDFGHLAQINRVLAKQYKEAVGPWVQYLSVMRR
jgi:hypothetical protein